jgi:hypothetical protein
VNKVECSYIETIDHKKECKKAHTQVVSPRASPRGSWRQSLKFLNNDDTHEEHPKIIDDMEVTEYAPDVFAQLRKLDGYGRDNYQLKKSFDLSKNLENIKKAGESGGKSGAFFFFSYDGRFIIKTMSKGDFDGFMRFFRDYFRHLCQNPDSLLGRIYGVYQIKIGNFEPVYMMIMGNGM